MSVSHWEFAERRALALLVFVDALGARVQAPVEVSAPGLRLLRKQPGEVVVMGAPGLEAHDVFASPPAVPAVESRALPLDIRPRARGVGARRFVLRLPRDPAPAEPLPANSLFRPVEIPLLPEPGATPTGLAAAVLVTLRHGLDDRRIEGALIRCTPDGVRPMARAMTNAAGEALLLVPGVPISVPGPAATVLPDLGATLDAVVDPDLIRLHRDDELDAARAAAQRQRDNFLDPDDLEARLGAAATPATSLRIAAGRLRRANLSWTP